MTLPAAQPPNDGHHQPTPPPAPQPLTRCTVLALAVAGLFGPTLTAESWTPWLRSAATAAVLVVLAVVVQLARAKCAAIDKAP